MPKELTFTDSMTWNATERTGISVRDGVISYYGFEIGQEPADKLYTVYRSPATIAQAALRMPGILLINGHIDPDEVPDPSTTGGKVESSEVVDHFDEQSDSKLAVMNKINVTDEFNKMLKVDKYELSLGYKANLIPHDVYDFEQRNIEPKHLATVPAGRCGSSCSFIDRKGIKPMPKKTKQKLSQVFLDEKGEPNLEQIVEIAQALPDALKELSIDEVKKVLPVLKQIVEDSTVSPVVDDTATAAASEEVKAEDEVADIEDKPKDEAAEAKKFEDAVTKVIAHHTEVIEKARNFVDGEYRFTGKSTSSIMRDALAAQYGTEKFTDAELPIAFKLLKATPTDVKNFGDAAADASANSLTARVEQSIKES